MKAPGWNDLKLVTQSTSTVCRSLLTLCSKGHRSAAQDRHFELLAAAHIGYVEWIQLQSSNFVHKLPAEQKLCRNVAGVTEYNSL